MKKKKNYIHFGFSSFTIHDLLLFTIQHKHRLRVLHNHSLTIFQVAVDVLLLLLLCLEKILDIFEERGSRGSRKLLYLKLNRYPKCCNCPRSRKSNKKKCNKKKKQFAHSLVRIESITVKCVRSSRRCYLIFRKEKLLLHLKGAEQKTDANYQTRQSGL